MASHYAQEATKEFVNEQEARAKFDQDVKVINNENATLGQRMGATVDAVKDKVEEVGHSINKEQFKSETAPNPQRN